MYISVLNLLSGRTVRSATRSKQTGYKLLKSRMRNRLLETFKHTVGTSAMSWPTVAVGVVLGALIASAPARVAAAPSEQGDGDLGPGCASSRPAIAHYSDGIVAEAFA